MAIEIAKAKAGIPADRDVQIVELPEAPMFNPSLLTPKIIGVQARAAQPQNELIEHLRFRLEHNGVAMPIMPLDYMDMIREAYK